MWSEMDEDMLTREQTILLVSEDAALCTAARLRLECLEDRIRVSSVTNIDAARLILEDATPAVILFEQASTPNQFNGANGKASRLNAAVTSLALHAPVVVIGRAEQQNEISALVAAGAADYVERNHMCLPAALGLVEKRLRQSRLWSESAACALAEGQEDFGEILRHELNNPLTGILGNAELLLAEIRRKNDNRLPEGGQQRLETIAALAVRLRETIRRLSQEWESRRHPLPLP
jgi:signal transduction histidine kinase